MFDTYSFNPELAEVTKHSIKTKSYYLRTHFERIESIFKEESDALWEECRAENERTKDHTDDSQYDYRASDSLMDIEFIYLRLHRYSAVLAAYSYLENSMNKICINLENSKDIPLTVTDMSGQGIDRCKLYLDKMCNIDFMTINSYWSRLKDLNKLRNCIVHGDGDAERVKSRNNLINLIENHNELSFIENKLVMISEPYIKESIDDIEFFLSYLVDKDNKKK